MGRWRRRMLGLSAEELTFKQRGFRCNRARTRVLLERGVLSFLEGYHAALEEDSPIALNERLGSLHSAFRGFGFEGAGSALALLDAVLPVSNKRLGEFLSGQACSHAHRVYFGVGQMVARWPWRQGAFWEVLDPHKSWLVYDGWGFHQGYFGTQTAVFRQRVPWRLRRMASRGSFARRCFDQGLGRSLWFIEGADASRIARRVGVFAEERRPDLWIGVGQACAYNGGMEQCELRRLQALASEYSLDLAQGVALAAQTRCMANNVTPATELACGVICGLSTLSAAAAVVDALADSQDTLTVDSGSWRSRLRQSLVAQKVA